MGIRGDSVLVPGRPAFWIDAEVVPLVEIISTHPPTKSHGPGGGWVGIRGDSVLVPWRPFFWNDAEVVRVYFAAVLPPALG